MSEMPQAFLYLVSRALDRKLGQEEGPHILVSSQLWLSVNKEGCCGGSEGLSSFSGTSPVVTLIPHLENPFHPKQMNNWSLS